MSMKELGLRCPKCRQTGYLNIECVVMAHVNDAGADYDGDVYWDNESPCICPECEWEGRVEDAEICLVCEDRGYVHVYNEDKKQEEVQRCDACGRFDTDAEAQEACAKDHQDGGCSTDDTGSQAPVE